MARITAEEFNALPESLKTEFAASGDGYELVKEDVEGLKKSKAEILAEKKRLADEAESMRKRLAEIDAKTAEGEEEKLKAAGAFKELEEKLRAKIAEQEAAHADAMRKTLDVVKAEKLKNTLTAQGILPDRVKYAVADIGEQVELVSGEHGFELHVKNGIGDAKEFDELIGGLKEKSPFFFAANTTAGSGASGSQGNGGGGSRKWAELTRADKTAAIRAAGGDIETAQKQYQ